MHLENISLTINNCSIKEIGANRGINYKHFLMRVNKGLNKLVIKPITQRQLTLHHTVIRNVLQRNILIF